MSAYDTPTDTCPYCGTECEADWVDVGVGMVQCGPYYCPSCEASQIGIHDSVRILTDEEKDTGWYSRNSPVSDKANTYNGKPIDHKTAKELYTIGLLDEKPTNNLVASAHCHKCNVDFHPKTMGDGCPNCKVECALSKNVTVILIQPGVSA